MDHEGKSIDRSNDTQRIYTFKFVTSISPKKSKRKSAGAFGKSHSKHNLNRWSNQRLPPISLSSQQPASLRKPSETDRNPQSDAKGRMAKSMSSTFFSPRKTNRQKPFWETVSSLQRLSHEEFESRLKEIIEKAAKDRVSPNEETKKPSSDQENREEQPKLSDPPQSDLPPAQIVYRASG